MRPWADDGLRPVLLAVRLGSVSSTESVAERASLSPPTVERVLSDASERGWVRLRSGTLGGWMLTSSGRSEGERRLAEQVRSLGAADAVESSHDDFLQLNDRLLELTTRWQLRDVDGEPRANDHHDVEHDREVLAAFRTHRRDAERLLVALEAALPLFDRYRPGLSVALDRSEAGEIEFVAGPLVPSYHTLWFELHEHLLATLGLDREDERRARRPKH